QELCSGNLLHGGYSSRREWYKGRIGWIYGSVTEYRWRSAVMRTDTWCLFVGNDWMCKVYGVLLVVMTKMEHYSLVSY
ncbi:unnamed protein product, partial [Ilex paraguariensis]